MFHQGDLQSGIALALQQSKSVSCFVTDDSEESKIWEEEWLQDSTIAGLLASKSVNLRLQAGSVEAGFLAAFCPIHKTPALVVVYNGQLRLSLFAGVEKEAFLSQVAGVLKDGGTEPVDRPASPSPQEEPRASVTSNPEPAQTAAPSTDSNPTDGNTPLTSLLPDRAARLEAERRRAAEAEAAARRAKAAGKRRAVEEETSQVNQSSKMSYAAQEKLRKQAQQSELQRILDRVEADKRERREQAEMRRRLREAEASGSPNPDAVELQQQSSTSRGPASKSGNVCLRIRLLDGSQLRDYFSPTATLAKDVRPRVDAAIAPSTPSCAPPYTFKLLLAPQHPNRNLSTGDETTPLKDLEDVAPSATLVLMPVRNAAAAYTGGGGGYIGSVYGALLAAYNLFYAFLGTFFAPFARGGGGGGAAGSTGGDSSSATASSSSSAREGHASRRGNSGAGDVRNSSPAAAAASSSWSAKHRNASINNPPSDPTGSGSGFDGQADPSRPATSAAASTSGSSSPIGGGGGGLRIRTLRDRLGEDDDDASRRGNEYYNGNSLGLDGDDADARKDDGARN
ncbi:hypothetical protein IWZ01DRAFT_512346 [Phyllosticta capitalensis]